MNVRPCTTVEEEIEAINAHNGTAETFTLPIADSLNDTMGAAMAIITDRILARGWAPDGYEQGAGFKVYRYKSAEW
jgi:hypothetical protein